MRQVPIRLRELHLPIEHEPGDVRAAAARALGVGPGDFRTFGVLRRALDARRKDGARFVYTVRVALADPGAEEAAAARAPRGTAHAEAPEAPARVEPGTEPMRGRALVIGAGPAGIFAAIELAEHGYAPLVIERGKAVEGRGADVERFALAGGLDPESNVVFGEGGAGTYSDGKLTHRTESPEADAVVEALAACGAPEDVLIDARPHVGSDRLPGVVARLRKRIERAGGEFRFGCRAASFALEGGRLSHVTLEGPSGREDVPAGAVVLAPGLSARDTWRALDDAGVRLVSRPTLVGLRVEHPQALIDRAQLGALAGHPRLGPAEYALRRRGAGSLRPVHSFCMCPGGRVIAVASAPGMLSTNGMSCLARDSGFASAALVTPVGPGDYGGAGPMAGVEFIERLERAVFEAGGSDYALPCLRLADFLGRRVLADLPPAPEGTRRRPAPLWDILPAPVVKSIHSAARAFARQVQGFAGQEAAVYGAELRTGSPVRIERGPDGSSVSATNLFPAGEGAGYAGGIVSSAVDGLRQAVRLVARYARPGSTS